jgi:excisionase family DNA binding protein
MAKLFTTRQLQDLLKIDRVTVYRMLNDGRLKGVKVGNQWRFPQGEIDRIMGEEGESPEPPESPAVLTDFPADCVQRVQEIFAGIIGIGAVIVTLKGETLTEPTYSNHFCKLMLSSPSGRQACQASWRKIALRTSGEPPLQICHAGLRYQRAQIQLDDRPAGWLIAGQFYTATPDHEQDRERLEQLARKYDLPLDQLTEAAAKIPVLKKYQQDQVREWTPKVADTVQSILCERSDLMNRLQRIADLSTIRPTLSK